MASVTLGLLVAWLVLPLSPAAAQGRSVAAHGIALMVGAGPRVSYTLVGPLGVEAARGRCGADDEIPVGGWQGPGEYLVSIRYRTTTYRTSFTLDGTEVSLTLHLGRGPGIGLTLSATARRIAAGVVARLSDDVGTLEIVNDGTTVVSITVQDGGAHWTMLPADPRAGEPALDEETNRTNAFCGWGTELVAIEPGTTYRTPLHAMWRATPGRYADASWRGFRTGADPDPPASRGRETPIWVCDAAAAGR